LTQEVVLATIALPAIAPAHGFIPNLKYYFTDGTGTSGTTVEFRARITGLGGGILWTTGALGIGFPGYDEYELIWRTQKAVTVPVTPPKYDQFLIFHSSSTDIVGGIGGLGASGGYNRFNVEVAAGNIVLTGQLANIGGGPQFAVAALKNYVFTFF